jgi:hypothetical protein
MNEVIKSRTIIFAAVMLLATASGTLATVRYVDVNGTNATPPYTNWATAATVIQDAVDAAAAGDEIVVTNGVYNVGNGFYGSRPACVVVTNALTLRSVNGPQSTVIDGGGTNRCVALADGASLTGFTLTNGGFFSRAPWMAVGGGVFCDSTNAFLTNCVLTGNRAIIAGGACGGTLYNCTLTGNSADESGGGAYSSTLYNCILSSNSADAYGGGVYGGSLSRCTLSSNSAVFGGGGAYGSTLYNCTLSGNSSPEYSGGAQVSTLYNCTLTGNAAWIGGGAGQSTLYNCTLSGNFSSDIGGGAHGSTLYNCTVVDNLASDSGGGVSYSTLANCVVAYNAAWADDNYNDSMLNYCCTEPLPTNGVGNISVPPLFVDYANGNLRLQSNSPCINAGNNLSLTNYDYNAQYSTNVWFTNLFDLDGAPRIIGGTVDIGAYESQGSGSLISYAWLQQCGLPTDGSADFLDPDHDGMNNWQEWIAGTDPTSPFSALRLLSPSVTSSNVTLSWQSAAGVNYFLERGTNLRASLPFARLATGIPGQPGTTTYTDYGAVGPGPFFYRVGVSPP